MKRWLRRIFGALVWAYPRDFRDQYGDSMTEHFAKEEADGADLRRTVADALMTSLRMRFENVFRDLTYAARMNVRAPLFSLVVVGAIALAIAANTVAFALLDAVLLKPLPFANPDRLGFVWARAPGPGGFSMTAMSQQEIDALVRSASVFSSVSSATGQDVQDPDGVRMLHQQIVTPNYFQTLGVKPELGRFLSGKPNEAVISDAMWRSHYGASASVLGKTLLFGGASASNPAAPAIRPSYTIVGVAPPGLLDPFYGSLTAGDFWTAMPKESPAAPNHLAVFPIVRLRPGVTWRAAQSDVDRVSPQISRTLLSGMSRGTALMPGVTYHTGPIGESILGPARQYLWLVFAAVTGVLLIACANVANLLLARGAAREAEFSVRRSLGASPKRVTAQVFVETLLLAASGAAFGMLLAWLLLPWAKNALPQTFPRLHDAGINGTVLTYVCLVTVVVALLSGMLPAYKTAIAHNRGTASRLRAGLAILEIAIAFALVAGSGLLLRSFISLTSVPLGFSSQGIYTATIVPKNGFFTIRMRGSNSPVAGETVARVAALPGVQDAAISTSVPFQNSFMMQLLFTKPGAPPNDYRDAYTAEGAQVTQTYFRMLHVPLLLGREFNAKDYTGNGGSVVVNEAFVRKYFPNRNPLGVSIEVGARIVGVVGDTRKTHEQPPVPTVYEPFNGGFGPFFTVLIRTQHFTPALRGALTAILKRVDPMGGDPSFAALDDFVAQDESGMRTSLELLGALASIALVLALIGIYSIVSYSVERRFREIGIRMALGAEPARVMATVVRGALAQATIGIVLGLVVSVFTTKYLVSQLFQTSPLDPATLIGVAALLAICTAAAALVPGIRAALATPGTILRYE